MADTSLPYALAVSDCLGYSPIAAQSGTQLRVNYTPLARTGMCMAIARVPRLSYGIPA